MLGCYCTQGSNHRDNHCSRLPCSFQLLPQWLILIYLFQLFVLDAFIIAYCDIYYCGLIGVLIHHHDVRLVGYYLLVCLDVEVPENFGGIILNHLFLEVPTILLADLVHSPSTL